MTQSMWSTLGRSYVLFVAIGQCSRTIYCVTQGHLMRGQQKVLGGAKARRLAKATERATIGSYLSVSLTTGLYTTKEAMSWHCLRNGALMGLK